MQTTENEQLASQPNQTFSNAALIQQIAQYFLPAPDWQYCTMPLLKDEMWEKITELLPGYFANYEVLKDILQQSGFKYAYNEHNQKYYWLVTAQY